MIIEVNTAAPSFEGLHDITMTDLPPRRKVSILFDDRNEPAADERDLSHI